MIASHTRAAARWRFGLAAALLALPAVAGAQQGTPAPADRQAAPARRGFELFGLIDFAVTGMRAPTGSYRYYVSNGGPMDTQDASLTASPATAMRGSTALGQFSEIALFAAAAPGDRARYLDRIPSLSNVLGNGAAMSFNFHKIQGLQRTAWYAADGSLGFVNSGVRSSPAGCLNHSPPLPSGRTLMPGSDCPETWGLNGWQGRRPISRETFLQVYNASPNTFAFNPFEIPPALIDTSRYLGDRFQTYGTITDYSRDRVNDFGNVLPNGPGAPTASGYPLGLQWEFDAFTMSDAPGIVFWQATITNRTDSVYASQAYTGGIDYDSLYVGIVTRHSRSLRAHAGFEPQRGAAFFNEVGNDDATNAGGCDGALPVPGGFASDAYAGNCVVVGFSLGASAVVFLKSPIGDLRYKQFSNPGSRFANPTHPLSGDTITFNTARMCGDECTVDHIARSADQAYGVVASKERFALGTDAPSALSPLQYWMLFHPANGAATNPSLRVDLDNPRAGGGFNYTPLPGWRYSSRPAGGGATGSDTLFFDTCNPALDPAVVPIAVPTTRTELGRCTGRWVDTLPDRTINFTRNATWLGAGPFRLAAGAKTTLILAITTAPDSLTIESNVNKAIDLYQTFFVAPTPPPVPRITSVRTVGGNIRQTGVRLYFENRTAGYVDPFVLQLAESFETDTAAGSPYRKLNRLNPRILRPGVANDTGLTIADTLRRLAAEQIVRFNVYKTCNPGSSRYTRSTSPNICSNDRITDSLGIDRGPAPYATLQDTAYVYGDGNVLSGHTYQYVIVPVTRGVRLQLVTDSLTVGGNTVRTIKDTTLVAPRADLPTVFNAPNVATVYVPASVQAGGAPSRVQYIGEVGSQTFEGDSVAYQGPFVTITDSIPAALNYRLVFGDSVRIREFQTNAAVDSSYVVVYRSTPVGFNYTATSTTANTTNSLFSRVARPQRRFLDSLVFRRIEPVSIVRSIVGNTGAPGTTVDTKRNDASVIDLGGGRREVRTTIKYTGGAFAPASGIFNDPQTIAEPLAQGVLLVERNGQDVPVLVGNDFRGAQFGLSNRIVGGVDFDNVVLDVANRPVVTAYTPTGTPNLGGAQLLAPFFTDPEGGRFAVGVQGAVPTVNFQNNLSRFTGAATGEFVFRWAGEDFGPDAPFTLEAGPNALQQAFNASLAKRAVGQMTLVTDEVRTAIRQQMGSTIPAGYDTTLIAVKLPFKIFDHSRDRVVNGRDSAGREVFAAMFAADKFYSPETLPAGAIGAVPSRWLLLGEGADTARVTVPQDQWVPGEPLILLERVTVADTNDDGTIKRDAQGRPVERQQLSVIATRATIGCRNLVPAWCNPLIGRGGLGYSPTQQGYQLVVRTYVPATADREIRFAVTPSVSGTRVQAISRAQLDSVKVVPNPYVLYSSYEQTTSNEQRVMFTHLPPEGHIRIYTAAGQFVQQIRWTPADLNGNGDLYFNLLTREGTLMASGLYVFTVEATGANRMRRKQVGRFIIIR